MLFSLDLGVIFSDGIMGFPSNKYFLLLIFLPSISFSQEYVRNGSFEEKTWIYPFASLNSLKGWYNPNNATPDVNMSFNNIGGHQHPHSGSRFTGIFLANKMNKSDSNYVEYCANKMNLPLKEGKLYKIKLYISKGSSHFSASGICIGFTKSRVIQNNTTFLTDIDFKPLVSNDSNYLTDEKRWHETYAYYRAQGGERYLIIGYSSYSLPLIVTKRSRKLILPYQDTYYFIDDVSVTEVDESSIYKQEMLKENPIQNRFKNKNEGQIPFHLFDICWNGLVENRKKMFTNFGSVIF